MNYPKGVSPSFKKRANEAAFWEAWVGAVLSRANLWTIHHPFPADGGDYHGQSWDLDVNTSNSPTGWTPVECKSLSLTFTCPEDYPFDTVLICSANSWKRKWGDARTTKRDFLLISRETGGILWIPVGAQAKVVEVTDTTKEKPETYKAMQTTRKFLRPLYDFCEQLHGKAEGI